jgi:plasmid stabilization system protein ParE
VARDVIFLPEVESDIGEAYWWYEEKDFGLGDEFFRCLEEAFSRISAHPEHFPIRFDDVRRILVRRFPYAVYFYHDEANVFITCVFHAAQNPSKLFERPRNSNQAMEDNDLGSA